MDESRRRELKQRYKEGEKESAREALLLGEDDLNDLLDHLDGQLPLHGCDHSLRLTRVWASEQGVDADALATSLVYFGGHCDCEVAANVDPDEIF